MRTLACLCLSLLLLSIVPAAGADPSEPPECLKGHCTVTTHSVCFTLNEPAVGEYFCVGYESQWVI